MSEDFYSRTEMLLGIDGVSRLKNACVAVFGVGGVGSAVVEGLARAGVGRIVLVDSDVVAASNINRQIIALSVNIGENKVDCARKRILEINPDCIVTPLKMFFSAETAKEIDFDSVDYICDAIDCVTSKILLAEIAQKKNIGITACMGTGNKLDPALFEVSDIYKTSVCPLARALRPLYKDACIKKLNVVYSKELPIKTQCRTPGSISFVPPVAGYIMAGEAIKYIVNKS